jgi:hypothetical protein
MKKYPFLALLSTTILFSCGKSDLPVYNADNYIQFIGTPQDSVVVAFVFHPGASELKVPFGAIMSGRPYSTESAYKIGVDSRKTTAVEGVHYQMPDKTSFKPGEVDDTAYVTFFRTPEMETQAFTLVLKVEESESFLPGDATMQSKTFVVHDMLAQPDWWNDDIIKNYLGAFSVKKFRLMVEHTGVADLTDATVSEKRACAIQLKYYLQREKEAGRAVWDDELSQEMTVPVRG